MTAPNVPPAVPYLEGVAETPEQARPRSSGLLLHPTSLPGPHGIGDLGSAAFRFVDFLEAAGHSLWQILPLGPVGSGNSPYAAHSAFAGNPLLISLEELVDDGLVSSDELHAGRSLPTDHVDFRRVERAKLDVLRRALTRHRELAPEMRQHYDRFRVENAAWLDDYVLFAALSDALRAAAWQTWPDGVAHRESAAIASARARLSEEIEFHTFLQFLFWEQWGRLRGYANERGVELIGDIPIFVAQQSADVWAHPEMFALDDKGYPTVVAGVPPDMFSATGQRWGNPLYRWDVLESEGYAWWIERFRATLRAVDIIRIDHFRGFAAYYEIPARSTTAQRGRWVRGPGTRLFEAARRVLPNLKIVVEDLGLITPDVVALRQELGYPGMKVLQFAFGAGPDNPYLPHNFNADVVAYTGTHDNDTTVGWFQASDAETRHHVRSYVGVDGSEIAWDMIRLLLASVADRAVIPIQDLLALGGEARMNYPGKASGNWEWRVPAGQLTPNLARRLRDLNELYGRAKPVVSASDTAQ